MESNGYEMFIQKLLSVKRYDYMGLINFLLWDYRLVWAYWRRTDTVAHLPSRMLIDPSTICNLNCPLCVTGCNVEGTVKARLSFEKFRHIIDLNPRCRIIDLYNWGEPFLNPDIFPMIEYCNSRGIRTNIHTNMNLQKGVVEQLLAFPPTTLVISCDGIRQDSYSSYRKGGEIEKVMRNMEYLAARVEGEKIPIRLKWKFLYHQYNRNELLQARQLAKRWRMEFIQAPLLCFSKTEGEYWHGERRVNSTSPMACPHLWLRFHVNSKGYPVLCCSSYHKDDALLVDLSECQSSEEMLAVWNSSVFRRARRCFSHSSSFMEMKKPILCEICNYYRRTGGLDPEKHPLLNEGLVRGRKSYIQ